MPATTLTLLESTPVATVLLPSIPLKTDFGAWKPTFHFAIEAGNPNRTFAVDPTTGRVTLVAELDRETAARHVLRIGVTDLSLPCLRSTLTLTVIVTDVNDNAPVFELPEHPGVAVTGLTATVEEGETKGKVIYKVHAGDRDANDTMTYEQIGRAHV